MPVLMRLLTICAILPLLMLAACSHNIREGLDTSIEKYNDMLARNQITGAAVFVADSAKDAYITKAEAIKHVRIFDCRVMNVIFNEEKKSATVISEISYYLLATNRVLTMRDKQLWQYYDTDRGNGWRLTSMPPEFK